MNLFNMREILIQFCDWVNSLDQETVIKLEDFETSEEIVDFFIDETKLKIKN
jgi:hypothetical protein